MFVKDWLSLKKLSRNKNKEEKSSWECKQLHSRTFSKRGGGKIKRVVRGQIEKEKEDEVEGRTLKERKIRKRERGINMENCGRIKSNI
jgi:hypothetical protein